MTDSEYERLSAVVESEGMTLGEWCREVLAGGRSFEILVEFSRRVGQPLTWTWIFGCRALCVFLFCKACGF
jgi:hypothetical protein